jgi:hypothetical protein
MEGVRFLRKKLSDLKAWSKNPRRISDESLSGLKKSIARFGLVEPIVWNKRTGHVVGGHQRLKILRENGDTETDVVVVNLDPKDEIKLNLALNNPNIAGEFSDDLDKILAEVKKYSSDDYTELLLNKLEPHWKGAKNSSEPQLTDLKYQIIVECKSEDDQVEKIQEFEKRGMRCRALIL